MDTFAKRMAKCQLTVEGGTNEIQNFVISGVLRYAKLSLRLQQYEP